MKKIVCLAMILLALLLCASAAAVEIDIVNSGRFPDPVFQQYLLGIIPAGNDGFLTDEVIDGITEINVNTLRISDLTGIEVFKNLTALHCDGGRQDGIKLTKGLDVSGLTKLKYLYCQCNQIPSLNLSGCSSLQEVQAYSNKISSLNITGCSSLRELNISSNQLKSLDVSGHSSLKELEAYGNQLTSVNVSGCSSLETLAVSENKLTSVDISSCPKLNTLNVAANQLSSINISRCAGSLVYLGVEENKLTSLNINGCSSLVALFCQDNKIASLNITTAPLIKKAFRTGSKSVEGTTVSYWLDHDHPSGNVLYVDKTTTVIANNTVTFMANGGKGTMKPQTAPNNQAFTLNANNFTRNGWKFVAWNTKKDGSGISYANRASVTLKNKDLTLYAQWAKMKKISGLRLKAVSKNRIMVSWNKLTNKQKKECQYVQIQISRYRNFNKVLKTKKIPSSKTSFIFTGLKPNTRYYVRVRAYTKTGKVISVSLWSPVRSVRTKSK